jgi:hypothetical protein
MNRAPRGWVAIAAIGTSLMTPLPAVATASDPTDTQSTFGFAAPVAQAATGTFDGPGDKAITVADGLTVKVVSDKVAEYADQITPFPYTGTPTHLFY